MKKSYYQHIGVCLQEHQLRADERNTVKRLLNKKFNHTDEQINQICITIEQVLTSQPIYDEAVELPRQWTAAETVIQLTKLQAHLCEAQKIINGEFGLHVEGFIDQHYLVSTRKPLSSDYQHTDRGPVESILHQLEQAVSKTIEHEFKNIAETKRKPKTKSAQYHTLIHDLAHACLGADVQFKLRDKEGTPFYRLITWVIKDKLGDKSRLSLEWQIKRVIEEINPN